MKKEIIFFVLGVILIAVSAFLLSSKSNPRTEEELNQAMNVYVDEENKVDCYILDENKQNQAMSCIKK